jgi:putative tryptophan/tyrosine transport system substrate-binding protein
MKSHFKCEFARIWRARRPNKRPWYERQLPRISEHLPGLLQTLLAKTGSFFRFSLFPAAGFVRFREQQRESHRLLPFRQVAMLALVGPSAPPQPADLRAEGDEQHRQGEQRHGHGSRFYSDAGSVGERFPPGGDRDRLPRSAREIARWNAGDAELARIYAAQLIGLMPDVILAASTIGLTTIGQATNTVPVVFVQLADPVAQGFVPSLRQPGGNLTGFSLLEFSLGGKWLDLLKQIAPGLRRVEVMFNPDVALYAKFFMPVIETTAQSLGAQAIAAPIRAAADIEPALAEFASVPNGGLIVLNDSFTRLHYSLITAAAQRYRLPSIAGRSGFAKGGLMEYGADINLVDQYREAATYVDRILKGSKPGELPVQAPTKFRFVINLKTANALGLTIPETLLATADEVIQ